MSIINLLPDDYADRRRRHRANLFCMVLFVCVMAGVGAAELVSRSSLANARGVLQRVNHDYTQAGLLIDQMRDLEAQEVALRRRAELTAGLIERVPRSSLLAAVCQALPKHSCLHEVTLEQQRVIRRTGDAPSSSSGRSTRFQTMSGQAPAASGEEVVTVLEISGLASTDVEVARFIANLARCPLVATADLVYSQEKTAAQGGSDDASRKFQVKLELKPGADALDLRKGGSHARRRMTMEGSKT